MLGCRPRICQPAAAAAPSSSHSLIPTIRSHRPHCSTGHLQSDLQASVSCLVLSQHWRQQQRQRTGVLLAAAAKGFGSPKSGSSKGSKVASSKANSRAGQKCPCGSGQQYQSCCGRYHSGTNLAPSPEALLRARYSAYALQLVDYLVATTHKENPEHTGDPVTYARSLQRTARGVEYLGLSIMDPPEQQQQQQEAAASSNNQAAGSSNSGSSSSGAGGDDDDDAFLRFSVKWRPRQAGGLEELATETSHFKKVNGAWLYYAMVE